ncbi:uncharacterized protein H6S33_013132 [Morchella sextelata]|uniref:uncharacterized protein n=1 Tax=Morchella sextelata TaxID=1174677 RepID=UPI001D03999B|nr:uncharacterized protein H6S33_013132 [Morchella sextelata]KAH0609646.1 hypothetical protein H6S33_013132 [Morchella sextelata]
MLIQARDGENAKLERVWGTGGQRQGIECAASFSSSVWAARRNVLLRLFPSYTFETDALNSHLLPLARIPRTTGEFKKFAGYKELM